MLQKVPTVGEISRVWRLNSLGLRGGCVAVEQTLLAIWWGFWATLCLGLWVVL